MVNMTIFTGRTGKVMGWPDVCVSPQQETELKAIGVSLGRSMDSDSVELAWKSFVEKSAAEITRTDDVSTELDKLILRVLNESYQEKQEKLQQRAARVQHFNEMKQECRKLIESIRMRVQSLEEEYTATEEEARLANIDLQNMIQRQQQTLQTMSNVSKMLHDTAMAVIRNISGYEDEETKLREELALLRDALSSGVFPVQIMDKTYNNKEEIERQIKVIEFKLSQL